MSDMRHLLDDPLAQTSSGLLVANVTHVANAKNMEEALDAALKSKRKVFIAVLLTSNEAQKATLLLDEAAAEIAGDVCRTGNKPHDAGPSGPRPTNSERNDDAELPDNPSAGG